MTWPSKRIGRWSACSGTGWVSSRGARPCRQLAQSGGDGLGLRQHRIVSTLEIAAVPPRRTGPVDEPLVEVGLQGRPNECPRQRGGGARAKLHRLVEAEQW